MHELPKMAVIAARPGPVRNSLSSLLKTLPTIDLVAESKDADSLRRLGSQIAPDLVVIEASSAADGMVKTLRAVRANWPDSRILVLVETMAQEELAAQSGVDAVIFSGCRAPQLMVCLESLLGRRAERIDRTSIGSTQAL